MPDLKAIEKRIFQLKSPDSFNDLAVELFHFHFQKNPVYRQFVRALGISPGSIRHLAEIPFLPIEFFKSHRVLPEGFSARLTFASSGTTQSTTSKHLLADPEVYVQSFTRGFRRFFGKPSDFVILALLPSYLEQGQSSLVFMVQKLIEQSGRPESGFYLHEYRELSGTLKKLRDKGQKTILLGVTYALLDLAEQHPVHFPELLLVETGGMKGRRREMVRDELHRILKKAFGVSSVFSEYGMTELLSQAWSKGDGIFQTPPWMKVLIRDVNDPLSLLPAGKTGGINVIDLANLYSCPFLATSDLGKQTGEMQFSVLGRFDHSDVRGCNLMVE